MSSERCKRSIIIALTLLQLIRLTLDLLFPADHPILFQQPFSELFLDVVINGPIFEEIYYRGGIIGFISLIIIFQSNLFSVDFRTLNLDYRANNYPNIQEKQLKMVVFRCWETLLIVLSSYFFSLRHLPLWGTQTLFAYFISGIIYGVLFLRYGFFCSLIWHVTNNFLGLVFLKLGVPDIFLFLLLLPLFISYCIFFEFKETQIAGIFRFLNFYSKNLMIIWVIVFLIGIINSFYSGYSLINLMITLIWFLGVLIVADALINKGFSKYFYI